VNNAGIFGPQDFFETPDEEWERFFRVNVMSGVRLSRAYLPGMRDKGWGRVLFLSSESGLNIPADMIHYGVTKTADLALSRGLAKRMAGAVASGKSLEEARRRFRQGAPTVLDYSACCHGRRSRQPVCLYRLSAGVRDHRCGATR
jgi:hypothetical protein